MKPVEREPAKVEMVESNLKTHSFTDKIGTTLASFGVLKLKDSLFVWVGSCDEPKLMNMCVAMKSSYETLPLTSQILGPHSDDLSSSLASQLTKRLNKPVFVSVNLQIDRFLFPEVTKRLKEEINNNSEYF